jgi:hypothetical protein
MRAFVHVVRVLVRRALEPSNVGVGYIGTTNLIGACAEAFHNLSYWLQMYMYLKLLYLPSKWLESKSLPRTVPVCAPAPMRQVGTLSPQTPREHVERVPGPAWDRLASAPSRARARSNSAQQQRSP